MDLYALRGTTNGRPGRRPRVLIEDPALLGAFDEDDLGAFDVVVCSGPTRAWEACPLVASGRCPAGRVDAVVGALGDDWRPSVRAAWQGTRTMFVDGCCDDVDPAARLVHHLGAALAAAHAPVS